MKYKNAKEIFPEKDMNEYLEELILGDFQNFKLFALAEKIKSQSCHRPKPKMLYY